MIDNSKQIGSTSVTHIRPYVHNTSPKKYPVIQTSVKHIKKGLYFMDPRERPLMGGFCSGVNMLKSIVTCKIICRLFGEFFFSFLAFSYRGHGWLFKYSDIVCSSFISRDRIVLKHCLYKEKQSPWTKLLYMLSPEATGTYTLQFILFSKPFSISTVQM